MITFTSLQSKYPFNNAYINAYTINTKPAEDLKLMCRYSVPSVPPHLGSSKARAPLTLPLGYEGVLLEYDQLKKK
jgi:hypothetical protein